MKNNIEFIHHHDRKKQHHICWMSFSLGALGACASLMAGGALAVIVLVEVFGQ